MKKIMKHTPGSGEGRGGSDGSDRKCGEDGDLEECDDDECSESGDSDGEVADRDGGEPGVGLGLNSNNNGGCPAGQLPISPGSGSGMGPKPGNGHNGHNGHLQMSAPLAGAGAPPLATPTGAHYNGYASGSPNQQAHQQYYAQQLQLGIAAPPYLSPANSNNCGTTSNVSAAPTYSTYSNYCAPPSASPSSSTGSYAGSGTRVPGPGAYCPVYASDVKFDPSLVDGVNPLANGVSGVSVPAPYGGSNGRYPSLYQNSYDQFYCAPSAGGAHPISSYVGGQLYLTDGAHTSAGSPTPPAAAPNTGASTGFPAAVGAPGAAQYPFLISNYSPYYQWPGTSSFCELAGVGVGGLYNGGTSGPNGVAGDGGCGFGSSAFSSSAAAAASFAAIGHHRALNGGLGGGQSISPLSAASSAPSAAGPGVLAGAVGPLAVPPAQLTAV